MQNQLQTISQNFGMQPKSFDEAIKYANLICKSNLLPRDYQNNPANIISAICYGAELGLSPFQAMQSLAVINGRPTLYGDSLLAVVRASGLLEYIEEITSDDKAICKVKRKDEPKEVVREFSKEDAKKAGLLNKAGPWSLYTKRMLQMRARSWALRDCFTDCLRGVSSAEEMQDVVEYTVTDVTPPATPLSTPPKTLILSEEKFISFLPKYYEYFQNNDSDAEELINKISCKWEINDTQKIVIKALKILETAPENWNDWYQIQVHF